MTDNTNTDFTDLKKIKKCILKVFKIIGSTTLILLLAFVVYAFCQFGQDFPYFTWNIESNTSEKVLKDWKDTTSILNNFLSPIFLLLSVILLWLTWSTSKKELKETRQQLNFQSNRDSFMIIVNDLVETLNQEVKPSSILIERVASKEILSCRVLCKDDFKKYFLFEKQFVSRDKLKDFFRESFKEKMSLQSLIIDVVNNHDYQNATKKKLNNKLYGFLIMARETLGSSTTYKHLKNIRKAIVYSLEKEENNEQFELLCNILFCKASFEVIVFLHKMLTIELNGLDDKNNSGKLLEQLAVLNSAFSTRDNLTSIFDEYTYLDKKYINY